MESGIEQTLDLDLARQAQAGDESAFAEIVRRFSPRVFSVASRFFRERSQVEDAAQEVFLKAFTQLGSFEGRGSMEGWLTRIATNTCLNILRGSKRRPEFTVSDLSDDESGWLDQQLTDESTSSVENSIVAADLADRLLGTLSPEDQQALLMIDGENASIKEVAEATGWSESKVKVRAFRARRKVRETMEKLLSYRDKQVSK
ncbi:MAG TPA: sigma-70 family RNA polymerase sigma factor [Pyrinomonadaceae bacterium]|nr:sigma-70 family RNA polymerase sigma factor [Pyrinomonadaceae bacterium]